MTIANDDRDEPDDPESSIDLVRQAQLGDTRALNRLLTRYLPRLQRWASGRMPNAIRSMNDTGDIVQEAVVNALGKLPTLEIDSDGALLAYLRQSVHHRIIDQYRRHGRRPPRVEIPLDAAAEETSPLDAVIGAEMTEIYERALATLREKDRQLIVLHVEFRMKPVELARELGYDQVNSARVALRRALQRLAEVMRPAARR
jgi:RNA polymerase sigma-70 factor (ECF subfamily)